MPVPYLFYNMVIFSRLIVFIITHYPLRTHISLGIIRLMAIRDDHTA